MVGQLGDFTSFLEVAFAVNVLFGVWRNLFSNLLKKRIVVRRENAKIFAAINDNYLDTEDGYGRWHTATLRIGRICAIVFAFLIAIVVLVAGIQPNLSINPIGVIMMVIVALPWPVSFLIVSLAHGVYGIRDGIVSRFITKQMSERMKSVTPNSDGRTGT